jgi:hypothetical protein
MIMRANVAIGLVGGFVRFCSDIAGIRKTSGFDDERLAWARGLRRTPFREAAQKVVPSERGHGDKFTDTHRYERRINLHGSGSGPTRFSDVDLSSLGYRSFHGRDEDDEATHLAWGRMNPGDFVNWALVCGMRDRGR